ncbi:hypothetical protein BR93DRAFT_966073 [Coniochaeta sp. PMI_546]|nr:hypothetical protein BR93DRAFT_966073 [Coniochaeta sp. PMI_546]
MARQRLFVPVTALVKAAATAPRGAVAWRASSSFPIADPAFWKSMIPKPLRRTQEPFSRKKRSRVAAFKAWMAKEWNPATFFIIIFLLIGSMSINMIALKKGFETYMRQSEVRIGLLREVVEKLHRGEKVDVERVLGSGVPEKESEWEEVLNELEKEDVARSQKKKQADPSPTPKIEPALKGEPAKTPAESEPIEATSRDFF